MKQIVLILCISIFATLSLCSCSSSKDDLLKSGVEHAERTFKSLQHNELAKLSFQDLMGQGASLVTFVTAAAADGAELPPYFMDQTSRPWSVVLRQDEESGEIVIEGIGADLNRPQIVKRVSLPEFDQ